VLVEPTGEPESADESSNSAKTDAWKLAINSGCDGARLSIAALTPA
jgi:hypothetical protein